MNERSPCLKCGACCAYYRISFYWSEADDVDGGTVPVHLTRKLNDFRMFMKGTGGSTPRCVALEGVIGTDVFCNIYARRPSARRDFEVFRADGTISDRCDRARAAWGLAPLTPVSFYLSDDQPKAA